MPGHVCSKCGHVDFASDVKPEVDEERTILPRKVIRDKKEFDNTYHPGVESADLVHEVHWVRVGKTGSIDVSDGRRNPKQLCHNCGWTTLHELSHGYSSRLKVFHTRSNSAIWDLGPNGPWMLRDEPNEATSVWKNDYMVQQLIRREKVNIPLVEMHRFGGLDDRFHFTIMSRAKGSTMNAIWGTLTWEQKTDVAQDLKDCIKKWRKITRPHMQKADGSELRDMVIGTCNGSGCIKTGYNEEKWLENLTPAMRKSLLWELWIQNNGCDTDQPVRDSWVKKVDERIVQLKADFPRGGPYVLTHGDLNPWNIFISDANQEKKFKVSAIIDWELAGFFPWWVENSCAGLPADLYEVLGEDSGILHPGYDIKDWQELWDTVSPVAKAWKRGGNHTFSKHKTDRANRWYRPPFCACKPYSQEYMDNELGWEDEHLDVFDVDSTDSEEEQEEGYKKFPKRHREFLRWFNEISNYNSKDADSTLHSPP